jgi:hypothetical protein
MRGERLAETGRSAKPPQGVDSREMLRARGRITGIALALTGASTLGPGCNTPDATLAGGGASGSAAGSTGVGGAAGGRAGTGAGATAGESSGGHAGIANAGGQAGSVGGNSGCGAARADCDGDPANGCETDTNADFRNCGACRTACAGSELCSFGVCCPTGGANCDRDATNGCEADWVKDSENCGTCGTACGSDRFCKLGTCAPCPEGFLDCDRRGDNGCEVTGRDAGADCQGAPVCPEDGWEPNETRHDYIPPRTAEMKPLDPADNVWSVSKNRSSSYFPTFSGERDVDVFFIEVNADSTGHPRWDITLEDLPAGSTLALATYYYCLSGSGGNYSYYNSSACDAGSRPSTSGSTWTWCENSLDAPQGGHWWGIDCPGGGSGADSGILQIRIRISSLQQPLSCDPYRLTVKVGPA